MRSTGDGMTGDGSEGEVGCAAASQGRERPATVEAEGGGGRPMQVALPALRGLARPADREAEAGFAHPFERDFARILSFYRVRWAYEPTAFALSWDADGQPAELFTPDFYLPDQRLYVELTAMRQRLVTRKHRKVRRLRELYPGVRIKMLYRRDYQRLATAYACHPEACPDPLGGEPRGGDGGGGERGRVARLAGRVLFDDETIRRRIGELADAIAAGDDPFPRFPSQGVGAGLGTRRDDAGGAPVLLLAVGHGSAVFHAALAAALVARGIAVELDRVTLSRYRTGAGRRRVRVRRRPAADLRGRRLLVVEDVVSTGLSLTYLLRWLRRRGARPEVCALLDRRAARVAEVPIRYAGFEAPNEALVGFGLSLYRQFRELPFIAVVES